MMHDSNCSTEHASPGPHIGTNGETGELEARLVDVAVFVLHQPPLVMRDAPYDLRAAPRSL